MKIKNEHLQALVSAFAEQRETIELAKGDYLAQGLSFRRFAWDTFWWIKVDGQNGSTWACDTLYPYGVHDSHLWTAIKAALKAIGIKYE